MNEQPPLRDPTRVVAAAYVLAALCLLVPLALVGAAFAAVVLARRGRPRSAAAVIALALACTALSVLVFR